MFDPEIELAYLAQKIHWDFDKIVRGDTPVRYVNHILSGPEFDQKIELHTFAALYRREENVPGYRVLSQRSATAREVRRYRQQLLDLSISTRIAKLQEEIADLYNSFSPEEQDAAWLELERILWRADLPYCIAAFGVNQVMNHPVICLFHPADFPIAFWLEKLKKAVRDVQDERPL